MQRNLTAGVYGTLIIGALLVTVAEWVSAVTNVVTEIVAGVRAHQSGRDLACQATLGALLGFLITVLKRVLH